MQIVKLLLFISLTTTYTLGNAQNFDNKIKVKTEHPFIVKLSPQHFLLGGLPLTGEYGIFTERRIGRKMALEAGLAYMNKGLLVISAEMDTTSSSNTDDLGISGFRIQGEYKFYLNRKDRNSGFFIAPHFSFATAKYFEKNSGKRKDIYLKGRHIDFSILAGFRFAFGRFSLEPYVGGGYRDKHWVEKNYNSVKVFSKDDIKDIYFVRRPIVFKTGVKLGLAF